MRRLVVPVLLALTASLALALPASAATLVQVLGHKERLINHFGDPARGQALFFAEGQLLDLDDDGTADALRGKVGADEVHGVLRLALGPNNALQVCATTSSCTNLVSAASDNSAGVQPARARQWTPAVALCPHDTGLTSVYRMFGDGAVRWDDNWFTGSLRVYSAFFRAPILASDPACVPGPPPPSADVRITKTATVASVPGTADTAFSYTLRVENLDTADAASNVVVTDTLPAEVDLNGALPANCVDTDPGAPVVLRCTFGTLDPGEVNSVTVNVTADASDFTDGTIANTAQVTSSTADPNPANNADSVNVLVRPLADVTVDKEADQASVTVPGDTFRYVLRVTNTGPSAATNVTVVDTLPEGLEVVALPAGCVNDTDPTAEPDTITCTFGTLAAGASTSVSIDVVTDATRADDTLPYVNTARVTTSTYEQNTGNNSDTETTPVVPA
jgi:uncharacterized repeat protein (TIGR01451 family)